MKKISRTTGHRENGKWIAEKDSHKLRNQLSPYWTLSEILSIKTIDEIASNENYRKIITELVEQCEQNKNLILELITKMDNEHGK